MYCYYSYASLCPWEKKHVAKVATVNEATCWWVAHRKKRLQCVLFILFSLSFLFFPRFPPPLPVRCFNAHYSLSLSLSTFSCYSLTGSLLGRLLGSLRSSSSSSSHPPLATVSSPLLALGSLFTSYNSTTGLPTQQPPQPHPHHLLAPHHHQHQHQQQQQQQQQQQALPHFFFGSLKGNYNLTPQGDPDSSRDSILLLRSSEDGTNNGLDSESDHRDRSFR